MKGYNKTIVRSKVRPTLRLGVVHGWVNNQGPVRIRPRQGGCGSKQVCTQYQEKVKGLG